MQKCCCWSHFLISFRDLVITTGKPHSQLLLQLDLRSNIVSSGSYSLIQVILIGLKFEFKKVHIRIPVIPIYTYIHTCMHTYIHLVSTSNIGFRAVIILRVVRSWRSSYHFGVNIQLGCIRFGYSLFWMIFIHCIRIHMAHIYKKVCCLIKTVIE